MRPLASVPCVLVLVGFLSDPSAAQQSLEIKDQGGEVLPLVLLHGLFASAEAMSHIAGFAQADYPGIYIHNVEIGDGKESSLLIDMNRQAEMFAATVKNDSRLANGFNLVCHSQGGLTCRTYIERFNDPKVYNFISLAGPHDGQFGVPDFPNHIAPWVENIFSQLLNHNYSRAIQSIVSFAAYWKDPTAYDEYLEKSIYLADINNERAVKNPKYRTNLASLNTLALVYSTKDTIVIPNTSPIFQFFAVNSTTQVVPLKSSQAYQEDWLGLKTLDGSGRLQLNGVNCTHQDLPRDDCKFMYDDVIKPLLNVPAL